MPTPHAAPGLSPPTRGNLHSAVALGLWHRSIPAHAGEPSRSRRQALPPEGLSPPTRGNHSTGRRLRVGRGSIPAHAGEPTDVLRHARLLKVYPRPRGGTGYQFLRALFDRGLSPPTRGNPGVRTFGASSVRSIPAHAGEPPSPRRPRPTRRVYPRPRGGTTRRPASPP